MLAVSQSRGDCTLPKNVKKFHVGKRNNPPHLEMLDPYGGFGDAVTHIPKINSPLGVGRKPQYQRGLDLEPEGGGPPRYTVVKMS